MLRIGLKGLVAKMLVVAGTAVALSPAANAAEFKFRGSDGLTPNGTAGTDYQQWASGDRTGADGAGAVTNLKYTSGSVSVTATGEDVSGSSLFAYQDWRFPFNAGLGVTSEGTKDAGSDDNVAAGQVLVLTFSESVSISKILATDVVHTPFSRGDKFLVDVDGGGFVSLSLYNGGSTELGSGAQASVVDLGAGLVGTTFKFKYENAQFYINLIETGGGGNQQVPEPGTFALLGLGALGYGIIRRRRRA